MENNSLKAAQYATDTRFNARILIHTQSGVNKTPWPIWLFSQYEFTQNERIIEFGCGTGLLWKVNMFRVQASWEITLTDFSQGMLDAARNSIGDSHIQFKVVDLAGFRCDHKYSRAIANHMLYHIDARDAALHSIYDSLEDNGILYASTVGNDDMKEMNQIISGYTGNSNYKIAKGSITESFSLENGREQLSKWFPIVEKRIYEDSLEITDADDFTNYALSCNNLKPGITVLDESEKDGFRQYIESELRKRNSIHITKSSGTFIAKK